MGWGKEQTKCRPAAFGRKLYLYDERTHVVYTYYTYAYE